MRHLVPQDPAIIFQAPADNPEVHTRETDKLASYLDVKGIAFKQLERYEPAYENDHEPGTKVRKVSRAFIVDAAEHQEVEDILAGLGVNTYLHLDTFRIASHWEVDGKSGLPFARLHKVSALRDAKESNVVFYDPKYQAWYELDQAAA